MPYSHYPLFPSKMLSELCIASKCGDTLQEHNPLYVERGDWGQSNQHVQPVGKPRQLWGEPHGIINVWEGGKKLKQKYKRNVKKSVFPSVSWMYRKGKRMERVKEKENRKRKKMCFVLLKQRIFFTFFNFVLLAPIRPRSDVPIDTIWHIQLGAKGGQKNPPFSVPD